MKIDVCDVNDMKYRVVECEIKQSSANFQVLDYSMQ